MPILFFVRDSKTSPSIFIIPYVDYNEPVFYHTFMEADPVPVVTSQASTNDSLVHSSSNTSISPNPPKNNRLKILLTIFAILFVVGVGSFVYLEKKDREKRNAFIAEEPGVIKASPCQLYRPPIIRHNEEI